jgi:magnesium-transporting ATPase (P-type)
MTATETRTNRAPANGHTAWHALPLEQVESLLGSSPRGLTPAEADERLRRFGPNQMREEPPTSPFVLLLHQFQSPLIYILLLAALVTLVLGEYVDVAVIVAVLLLNAVIGFTQERRAEQSVRALARMVAPHAHVIRADQDRDIESRDVVPGDVVLLESGARVPADLRVFAATALMVDESALTGESVPVAKQTAPLPMDTVLADRTNMAYAGTIVTSGRGRGYAVATGEATELGAIATEVREEERGATPLQRQMARFARTVGIAVAAASALTFAIGFLRGEPVAHMFMVAVTLAVAAIPEGLPVVLTITLAVGVRRMAKRNAIIRRLPAVETLGSATRIGSDKTGTLTENRMTVQRIWAGEQFVSLNGAGEKDGAAPAPSPSPAAATAGEALRLTLVAGVLANEAEATPSPDGWEIQGDPTEAALLIAADKLAVDPRQTRLTYPVVAEIPFEPERQYSASVREHEGQHIVFVKGAPERVLAMCGDMLRDDGLAPVDAAVVHEAAQDLAGRGLRVLAMAYRVLPERLARPEDVVEPAGMVFLGLQGMMDPPRQGVREAILSCREAGIRVLMITGDHAATARAIGQQLAIGDGQSDVLTGADLEAIADDDLRRRVDDVSIYARVAPDQKLRVVRALQDNGQVVAVTGDGVNDAPALKAADIGVAMGKSGTDVAREAADMVLADDNFVSIAAAVEEGRVTFDNVRKATFFLVGTGAAVVLTILSVLVLGWPLPFLPAQLLWLNLVTNGLQDVALAFEPSEPDVLRRRPRSRKEGILSRLLWERTALTALVLAVGTLLLFRWELDRTGSLIQAQTVALTTMVVFQAFQAGNARSDTRSLFRMSPFSNPFLFISTVAAMAVHIGALYFPPTQFVLRVEPIDLDAWLRIVLTASTILVAVELHKFLRRRWPVR